MTVVVFGEPLAPPLFPHGETVQRHAWLSTSTNAHGVETYIRADPYDVEGVGFDPGSTYETNAEGVRIVTQPTLYVAFEQAAHPLDQWTCRGVPYDVDGSVDSRSRNPFTGWEAGRVIKLKRAVG